MQATTGPAPTNTLAVSYVLRNNVVLCVSPVHVNLLLWVKSLVVLLKTSQRDGYICRSAAKGILVYGPLSGMHVYRNV